LQVTLVEPNRTFTACPLSNEVIAGLRGIEAQQFGYDKIAADGVAVIAQAALKIDPQTRMVGLADGTSLGYDRLVLSPGIDLRYEAIPGYDEAVAAKMPHAWKAGEQTALLRRQLEAMDDGGMVALAVPAAPYRCPPAPYERASLIAHYLKTKKPRSKVLILDAKDAFPQQRLFENAWKELYPGMIERISLSQGGRVVSVDPTTNTLVTDFGNYDAQVANVIPPQKAGHIAAIAGAVDNTGWCPIDPATFASKLVPNIHVIGDACIGGGIPKSASAASAEAKACAGAVANLITAAAPAMPKLDGTCYNTVAPGYAFSLSGIYQPRDDIFAEVEGSGFTSPVDAPSEVRLREADQAQSWYKAITVETFG
jgi:NADPH-dependent 2,4-dienoyl-CoA reductase/sulfur reductase-like enzyme